MHARCGRKSCAAGRATRRTNMVLWEDPPLESRAQKMFQSSSEAYGRAAEKGPPSRCLVINGSQCFSGLGRCPRKCGATQKHIKKVSRSQNGHLGVSMEHGEHGQWGAWSMERGSARQTWTRRRRADWGHGHVKDTGRN